METEKPPTAMLTSTSLSLDQIDLILADRIADARHAALVHQATSASAQAQRRPTQLRLRLAAALRTLACRLDPSPALNA